MKKCSAFVLAALLISGSAFAETKEEIEIRNAQTRFEEGLALADQGQHEEARVKFVQAYAVLKSTKVLYNLAIAEKKTSHPVECIQHFRIFLKDPTITPDLRARAEQIIAELSKTTSRVEIAATPGADVRIDGVAVGRAPFDEPVDVAVGHHTVAATLDANNKTTEIDTTAGALAKVDVSFPGVVVGPTPGTPSNTGKFIGAGVLAGVGVLGLIGWGAFAAVANGAESDANGFANSGSCVDRNSARCQDLQSNLDKQGTFHALSLASLVVGGVFIAGAAGVFAWALTSKPKQTGITFVPTLTAGGVGALLQGSF